MKGKLFKCLIAMAAFLVICSPSFGQEKTVEKTFDGVDEISMELASGDVTIEKGGSSTIEITLTYTYDDDEFKPVFNQNGSRLKIEEDFEKGSHSGSSNWIMKVPDGIEVDINTGSGDVDIEDLKIDFEMNGGSGDLELNNNSGSTKVNLGSGDVKVEEQDGVISINIGSGDVEIESSKGDINVNTGSGSIILANAEADFSVNSGSGDIEANNVTLTGHSGFNVGSGNAKISLASALDYNIGVSSGSGDASIDFNGIAIEGMVTMKANRNRGEIEAPFKFDKEEEEGQGRNTTVVKTARMGSKDVQIKVSTGSGTASIEK